MKIKDKIIIKKNGEIKAIIGNDGKVLAGDKKDKALIEGVMNMPLIIPVETSTSLSTTYKKVESEGELVTNLFNNLYPKGYTIEQ